MLFVLFILFNFSVIRAFFFCFIIAICDYSRTHKAALFTICLIFSALSCVNIVKFHIGVMWYCYRLLFVWTSDALLLGGATATMMMMTDRLMAELKKKHKYYLPQTLNLSSFISFSYWGRWHMFKWVTVTSSWGGDSQVFLCFRRNLLVSLRVLSASVLARASLAQ